MEDHMKMKKKSDWDKYLQTTCLTKDWRLDYRKNPQNPMVTMTSNPIRKWAKEKTFH